MGRPLPVVPLPEGGAGLGQERVHVQEDQAASKLAALMQVRPQERLQVGGPVS